MKRFIYVTGGKGGIGKSFVTSVITDCATAYGLTLLIDTDTINPDSSAPYKNDKQADVQIAQGRIRSEDADGQVDTSGLIDVLTNAADSKADTVVVDAPAGETMTLQKGGEIIHDACKQLGTKSIIVWIVDAADRTAMNGLVAAWDGIKDADMLVIVKNHRTSSNFDAFDSSERVQDNISTMKHVVTIDLPKTAQRIMEAWKVDRKTLLELATTSPIGTRVEAQRIRKEFKDQFSRLFEVTK